MKQLRLYTTEGCHLCQDASDLLLSLMDNNPPEYDLAQIDIAEDNRLMDRYGFRIPVVKRLDTGAELGWPFDYLTLVTFLR